MVQKVVKVQGQETKKKKKKINIRRRGAWLRLLIFATLLFNLLNIAKYSFCSVASKIQKLSEFKI